MQENLKLQFEQIFVKHYERLTNSQQTISGLPFTLENIVCFILFGGRELDIEDIYGDVSERYSMETFMADAREAGIEADERLHAAISQLVAQKLLHLQPDGHFYSYQATRETARMLNRIYPKMQGLSLLAYIGQTIQEVESGRIDLGSAVSRFDQTLQKQGVLLPKPKIPVITPPPKPAAQQKKSDETKSGSSRVIRDYVVTSSVKAKIDKSTMPDEVLSEPAPERVSAAEERASGPAAAPEEKIAVALEPAAPAAEMKGADAAPDEPALQPAVIMGAAVDDEAIAAKIAAFEKELALVCPICKVNVLKEEKTVAGKLFYSCTSDKCNFISWGRPHHIQCARCKNPFMVEVTESTGQMVLKCPRATCQHRQPLSPATPAGGVKTVVRKRLVRRKV
ncbi:MAG: topoisomerase DNA-binding C4 zinc finger domain-containing protein [Deltaproteobacteria bacterium]